MLIAGLCWLATMSDKAYSRGTLKTNAGNQIGTKDNWPMQVTSFIGKNRITIANRPT